MSKFLWKWLKNHEKQSGNSKELLRIIKNIWVSF